jgi:phytanoyl-CoA hydroxylase
VNNLKEKFQQDGFLVIKNFIPEFVCDSLLKRANELVDTFNPNDHRVTFNTKDQSHGAHQYFLNSSENIHFFFEKNSFDEKGELVFDKHLCINKMGHALHEKDPVFYMFNRMKIINDLLHKLDVIDPVMLQSMYIFKQPRIGGEVTCHQDATYLRTRNNSMLGLWFAIEDATLENGCLWAIPGGHQTPLKEKFIRHEDDSVRTEKLDSSDWELDKMVPLQVPKGSLIVLDGLLPHMSYQNTSDKSRHAYTLHVMAGDDEFERDNWMRI